MKTADDPSFFARVERFLRWFLNVTPDVVVEPRPAGPAKARSRTVARRKRTRLRAKHSGPVRAADKGKP